MTREILVRAVDPARAAIGQYTSTVDWLLEAELPSGEKLALVRRHWPNSVGLTHDYQITWLRNGVYSGGFSTAWEASVIIQLVIDGAFPAPRKQIREAVDALLATAELMGYRL